MQAPWPFSWRCFIANPTLRKTQWPSHEIQTTTDSDLTPMKEQENPSAISPPPVETQGPRNDVTVRDPTILDGNANKCTRDITLSGSNVQRVSVGSRFYRSVMDNISNMAVGFNSHITAVDNFRHRVRFHQSNSDACSNEAVKKDI